MKKIQKYLIGLGVTSLIFGISGHIWAISKVPALGNKIETQLVEYQAINNQLSDLESTVQEIELELAELEEDYEVANELTDQYANLQKALSEAESFNVEGELSDEISALKDADSELKNLENTKTEILLHYEAARIEAEKVEAARVEAARIEAARIEADRGANEASNETTVYWTVNGSVWHRRRNCRGLNAAKEANIRSGTIAESGKDRECKHSANGR